jgi:hypothetical protein
MKLTIHNIDSIKATMIHTTHANWVIADMVDNGKYYSIKVTFAYGKTLGKKHPKHVYFQLDRDRDNEGYYKLNTNTVGLTEWVIPRGYVENREHFVSILKTQLDKL